MSDSQPGSLQSDQRLDPSNDIRSHKRRHDTSDADHNPHRSQWAHPPKRRYWKNPTALWEVNSEQHNLYLLAYSFSATRNAITHTNST